MNMVGLEGLEPSTKGFTLCRSGGYIPWGAHIRNAGGGTVRCTHPVTNGLLNPSP